MYYGIRFLATFAAILPIAVLLGGFDRAVCAEATIEAKDTGNCSWDGKQDVASCIQTAINAAASSGSINS